MRELRTHCLEPAHRLLARIFKERRARWEAEQLAKIKAKGKAAKGDKWKAKDNEPAAPDTSNLPKLPEGWVLANLATIAELKGGSLKDKSANQPMYFGRCRTCAWRTCSAASWISGR